MILCVGQLAPYKGHQFLLEAMAQLQPQWPNAHLVLAGDGPLEKSLRQHAEQLRIDSSVHLLGYRTDVPDLIQACDLLVLVSPAEGLGTSVLDAMFAGKPVVGADAGGIPEILGPKVTGFEDAGGSGKQPVVGQMAMNKSGVAQEGPNAQGTVGWLVPPEDSQALATALAEALGSQQLRKKHGEAGLKRAYVDFTAYNMVKRMLDVYRE